MTVPTPRSGDELVLKATSDLEFIEMMRRMLAWSGRTAGQVATYGNLPRSTAYHFVSPKNTVLPKERGKVEAFARGCKLSRDQINQVMQIWDELSNTTTVTTGKEIVQAELADIIPIHQTRVISRPTDGGQVSIHGDIRVVNHHYGTGATDGNTSQDDHDDDDDDDDEYRGGWTRRAGRRSKGRQGLLLDILAQVLNDKRLFLRGLLLLSTAGMFLFGMLMVFASDKAAAMFVIVVFAAMTGTLLWLMKKYGRF